MPITYRFPLEEQTKYPGRIRFQVEKTTGYGLTVNDIQDDQVPFSIDQAANQATGGGNALENLINSFQDIIDVGKDILGAEISKPVVTKGDVVELYMPQGVQVQDGVVFDNVDFGVKGATAFDNASSLGAAAGRMLNPLGEINRLTEAMKAAPNKGDYAAAAASYAAQKAGPITGAVVSSALQVTTNPNTRAVFKTVPLREFSFSFKMLPQSQAEAKEMVDIIKFFRREIYPETIKAGNTPIAYKFPNKILTTMKYGNQDVGINILPAYIKAVSTTYNGSSQSFYRDGKFSEIDLTVTLIESRTLSREDINNEGSSGQINSADDFFEQLTENILDELGLN